jgi:hypothetical protein
MERHLTIALAKAHQGKLFGGFATTYGRLPEKEGDAWVAACKEPMAGEALRKE